MTKLTVSQKSQLEQAVAAGRAGSATLGQLASACDLAASAGLPGCAGELRGRLLRKLAPTSAPSYTYDIAVGLFTGIATHFLLRSSR